jgi:hypothetical protein
VLERVVVDIVNAPAGHGGLFESFSEFHVSAIRITVSGPIQGPLYYKLSALSLSLSLSLFWSGSGFVRRYYR